MIISTAKSSRKSVLRFQIMPVKMGAETEMGSVCVPQSSSHACPRYFTCSAARIRAPPRHAGPSACLLRAHSLVTLRRCLCVMCDCTLINCATCQMWQLLIKTLTNDLSPWNCHQGKSTFYLPPHISFHPWMPVFFSASGVQTFIRAVPQSNLLIDGKLFNSGMQEPCPELQLPLPIKWKPIKAI